jgi:hypothetical protein
VLRTRGVRPRRFLGTALAVPCSRPQTTSIAGRRWPPSGQAQGPGRSEHAVVVFVRKLRHGPHGLSREPLCLAATDSLRRVDWHHPAAQCRCAPVSVSSCRNTRSRGMQKRLRSTKLRTPDSRVPRTSTSGLHGSRGLNACDSLILRRKVRPRAMSVWGSLIRIQRV